MKRLIALLLGIVLLLTAVPALADEETDDLNEIARKVEEEYLLPLSEGEGAKTEVLEVCLEMLKDAKGGPKKKPLELYCRVLLAIENGEFEDGSCVLRAKIDMSSPNINMRDPVIYRVAHLHHHNTGDLSLIHI